MRTIITLLFVIAGSILPAQPGPPPGPPPPNPVPLTGVEVLIAAGALLGAKYLTGTRKPKS